jgi:RHS repeat-associated protein
VSYAYDSCTNGHGRLCQVSSSVSSTSYEFDPAGRVISSTQTTGDDAYTFGYAYNVDDSLSSMTYPSGTRTVSYSYDKAGRMTAAGNYATNIEYEAHGGVESLTLGNGLVETRDYNNRLQPLTIAARSLLTLTYGYGTTNNNGNIMSQTISSLNVMQTYSYDGVNRLTYAAESTNWSQTFGYGSDQYGNMRVTAETGLGSSIQPLSFNTNNRITGTGWSYDTAGNLTGNPDNETFAYDAENRQKTASTLSGSATYVYDGEGRRVKKTVGSLETVYVYDAMGRLAAEYGGTNTATGRQYLTADHLGSTRLVTNATGGVVERRDYLPFGEEIPAPSGSPRLNVAGYTGDSGITQSFTSKERDAETGLDYFGARYFSGAQGRFTSVDPIWVEADRMLDPQRLNLYAYGRNNPLRFTDPTGMELQVGNCGSGETVTSCVEKLKQGLSKEDRSAVSVVKGTGENGCTRGTYCVAVDKSHNSGSDNFKALEYVANKKGDVAILEGKSANDRVSSFSFSVIPIGAQAGYEPTMNKETGFMGITLNPLSRTPGIPNPYMPYSLDRDSHVVFATGMSLEDVVTTMHHEIRHIFLGDFGRLMRGDHPQSNSQTTAAEREAERNLGGK